MSVPISGVPDGNSKPSLTVIDQTTHQPFAVVGDSNLGVAFIQIVDNANNPLGTATHPLYTQLIVEPTINIGEVELTDGTNTANVLKADGTAAGQNAVLVAGTALAVPFTTTTAQAVATTDVSNYKTVAVHITGQGTGSTVNFQASNDNVNWQQLALQNPNATVSSLSGSEAGSNVLRYGALNFRYFRLNITGISAGTTAGVILFSTQPGAYSTVGVAAAQNGTWNVGANSAIGSAVPANAFYHGLSDGTNLRGATGNIDTPALITAAAVTSTQTGADQTNFNSRGVKVVLDMTTVGTGSVTLEIDGKDAASGKYYAILTGAAVVTNSTNVYTIYPGITVAANGAVSDILPKVWRVKVTANNANPTTYTVGASVIL